MGKERVTRADVIVVGARCAGAAVARLLANAGVSVALVDRAPRGTDTTSTHALMRGAVAQLSRWGLLDRITAADTPAIRQTTFWYDGDPMTIPITPRDGVDALYAPRRTLLDTVLLDAAESAGARVFDRCRATALLRHSDGRIAGLEMMNAGGRREVLHAPLVIGADGLRSTVATLVDAPVLERYTHATATLYTYFDGLSIEGTQWYFGHDLAAGAIPTNDGQTGVFVAVPPRQFSPQFQGRHLEGFVEALRTVAPALADDIGTALPAEGFRGFGGQPGQVRQSIGPGWALVGDAGAFRDPITAHGITDALRDAEFLADAILDGSPEAWSHYVERRDRAARPVAVLSDAIASFSWTLEEVRGLHHDLSRAMNRSARSTLELPPPVLEAHSREATIRAPGIDCQARLRSRDRGVPRTPQP